MENTISSPVNGLVVDKVYSWNIMEQHGWSYIGSRKEDIELYEVWECGTWKAMVNGDGKIISITEKSHPHVG